MELTRKVDANDPHLEKVVNRIITEIISSFPNERRGIFVAGGTQLLWNVLYELRAQHIEIPQDLGFCTLDSTWRWCQLIPPGITAFYQPCFELGEAAAKLLTDRMKGGCGEEPVRKVLQAVLSIGNSTAVLFPTNEDKV
jgi:DNA-binding LacI/PurR family transcriptional regulator